MMMVILGVELNVLYDFVNEVPLQENYEGVFEFCDMSFALDFENKQLAGYANVASFMREILEKEGMSNFYQE